MYSYYSKAIVIQTTWRIQIPSRLSTAKALKQQRNLTLKFLSYKNKYKNKQIYINQQRQQNWL